MKLSDRLFNVLRNILPSPLSIALLLTLLVFVVTFFTITPLDGQSNLSATFLAWKNGLWSNNGLVFLVQMMLMLILGHALALTEVVNKFISWVVTLSNNPQNMVWLVCFLTLVVSWFNWGLGLIFGAILSRKIGEHAELHRLKINYALVGAAGYSGLMFFHGGLSGSALVKISEPGHLAQLMGENQSDLPSFIGFNETVFSAGNMGVSFLVLLLIPLSLRFFAKRHLAIPQGLILRKQSSETHEKAHFLAEKIDFSKLFGPMIGVCMLVGVVFHAWSSNAGWGFITPNIINLTLFGLAFMLHGSIHKFTRAIEIAISDGVGILIQFPLYFGIMGLMKEGHLITHISTFFASIATTESFPIWAFFSAGFVNLFVPSGGGQWMVQGPIIIETCQQLGVPLNKGIMALAYGDQITNMLQPFWALPLLGVTRLKAKDILPYTLIMLVVGTLIYLFGLMVIL